MNMIARFFRPSDVEVWRQLADEVGGRFHEGDAWHRDKVEATVDGWTITLDTYFSAANKNEYTRMQTTVANPSGLTFTIYRRGLFSDLGKLLGMQDITIGIPEFDREFILKSNHEAELRRMLEADRIRELIAAQPDVHLMLDSKGSLCFSVPEVIRDIPRLKLLFDLFAEALDYLSHRSA